MKEGQSVHFSERYKEAIKTLLPSFEQGLAGFRNSLTCDRNLIYSYPAAICIKNWTV
jgi:hypothetical protein